MSDYPLGVIPSPPDERDFRYPAYGRVYAVGELPVEYVVSGLPVAVDDQGAISSCVAHSLGLISDWRESKEFSRPWRASRQWIYANRTSPYDYRGPGMQPRMALASLRRDGVLREAGWPGIVEFGREVWPAAREVLLPDAIPHNVLTYISIHPTSVTEIKSALFETGPILYCVPIHANFVPDSGGMIPLPNDTLRGYHALTIVGWRNGAWRIRNSWGLAWGRGGECWIPWGYPASEVWGVTDATSIRRREVLLTIGHTTMVVDGRVVILDVPPQIIDGRTMVPFRAVGEAFGCTLDWGPKDGPTEWVTAKREEVAWP